MSIPSSTIGKNSIGYTKLKSVYWECIPREDKRFLNYGIFWAISDSSEPIGAHDKVMWFKRPHGAPSGVCTGQVKPQASGNNFLTVVVFISVKYWPLWIERKWDRYLVVLSLSGTIYLTNYETLDFLLPKNAPASFQSESGNQSVSSNS